MRSPDRAPTGEGRRQRPVEREAVRTTIVGGRPPGPGNEVGAIPRGIEVLIKKASVDPEFRKLLLERRAGAAEEIGLALDPAEAAMLASVPAAQLEAIIAQTRVSPMTRAAFLGKAAALMLAALGAQAGADGPPPPGGIAPDRPPLPVRDPRLLEERNAVYEVTDYKGEHSCGLVKEAEYPRVPAEVAKKNRVLLQAYSAAKRAWAESPEHKDAPFPMEQPQPFSLRKLDVYTTRKLAERALGERVGESDRRSEQIRRNERDRLKSLPEGERKAEEKRIDQLAAARQLFEQKLQALVAAEAPPKPVTTRGIQPDRP